jgi:hypothetical protein
MGWILHSSIYYQMHVGFCGYIPLCQAPKVAASRDLEQAMLIRCGLPPGMIDQRPGSRPWVNERGRRGRHVVKSCPLMLIVG